MGVIRFSRGPFRGYRVAVDGGIVGTVTKAGNHKWQAFPPSTMRPPVRLFPSRKAAAEWLVAASGLWLVNP